LFKNSFFVNNLKLSHSGKKSFYFPEVNIFELSNFMSWAADKILSSE